MTLALVTGANRGIGLALVEQLVARGTNVIAACRTSSPRLADLGVEVVAGIDVTEPAADARLVDAVAGRTLDLVIQNAGILVWETPLSPDFAAVMRQFEVNALAPLRLSLALLPNLRAGSKIGLVTSRMGSIGDNSSGGGYGYRMSKAALNMAGKSLAHDLAPRGILVALLHPGMVKTDMIGGRGQIEPGDAAAQLLARIDALTPESSGTFLHANGEALPW